MKPSKNGLTKVFAFDNHPWQMILVFRFGSNLFSKNFDLVTLLENSSGLSIPFSGVHKYNLMWEKSGTKNTRYFLESPLLMLFKDSFDKKWSSKFWSKVLLEATANDVPSCKSKLFENENYCQDFNNP